MVIPTPGAAAVVVLSAALLACARQAAPVPLPDTRGPDAAQIQRDIEYLASDLLEGRGIGSDGLARATRYAAERYAALGLRSLSDDYFQSFTAAAAALAHTANPVLRARNVVAYLPGTDPALRGQVIVIGAHIDHLGRGPLGALDASSGNAVRNGADDNASGTAVVLELARLLRANPPRRSVLFANFSAEELGLLGSQYFVNHSPVPTDSIVAMLNFDMVGRLRGDSLIVYGVATAREMPAVLGTANSGIGLTIRGVGDGFGPSDHSSFYAKDIPVLHFFTNLHQDYHRATDDAFKINFAGAARVTALAERVVRELDRRATRLTFVRSTTPAPVAGARTGSSVYLGSIPDMSAGDVKGLRLTGVRAGSPADSAGLKAGDVVVEFAGQPVTDLNTYSAALYARKPGDEVDVVVLRNGERLTLRVRLGKRG
jgi:aminopeptidase YwaD